VEALERVLEGWAIVLGQDLRADLDPVVGLHGQDVRVKGTVVNRAHGHPVRQDRLAALRVLLDVGSVEEGRVAQAAQRAAAPVCEQHAVPERTLVEPGLTTTWA